MDKTVRHFARKILLIHLVVLVVVALIVVQSSREVYRKAREQALQQARKQQELLVHQTANGIENFYNSILNNLDLLKVAEEEMRAATQPAATQPGTAPNDRPADRGLKPFRRLQFPIQPLPSTSGPGANLPAILWWQLQGRASHFLTIDFEKNTARVVRIYPNPEQTSKDTAVQDVIKKQEEWLNKLFRRTDAGTPKPAISEVLSVNGVDSNLLCVPVPGPMRRLLVAIVPLEKAKNQFLGEVTKQKAMMAMLLDESMTSITASNPKLLGATFDFGHGPQAKQIREELMRGGNGGTVEFRQATTISGVTLEPALVTVEPVEMANTKWWVVISSSLANIDSVVDDIFERTLLWSAFVVCAITAILVSTSAQLIRNRMRLERERHRILKDEVSQARRIQLAWLPEPLQTQSVDIAAVNHPTSHISGDFYDWFELPDGRTVITIGDVTGHGMAAAFLMATTQLLLRNTMMRLKDPGRCLEEVNRQLCMQVFNGQFVTVLVMMVERDAGGVTIATAGHFPPLIRMEDGSFKAMPIESQLVMGVEPAERYTSEHVALPPDCSLLLYTDGVIDMRNTGGERFTSSRLVSSVQPKEASAKSILDSAVESLNDFRGTCEPNDDLTLVAVQLQVTRAPRKQLATV